MSSSGSNFALPPTPPRASVLDCVMLTVAALAALIWPVVAAQTVTDHEAIHAPFETEVQARPAGEIDDLVFAKLASLGIAPAAPCSDAVFVRRVYLDVIGTLPTAAEVQAFLTSRDPAKRCSLINRLLERPEYADYWTMKWCDLLRVKAEFPINLWPNAAQTYHHWILAAIRDNLPYDRFARELITANGSNFRVGPANFYRALQGREPAGIARTVALTFMGARAEKWPPEQLADLANFFAQIGYKATGEWKEEIVYFDPGKARPSTAAPFHFPDGTAAAFSSGQDPRAVFADWLVTPANPWFTRAIANRAWSWLLGRGLIHEPDDIRPDNPPVNPALLALLERELVAANYNVKQLFRLILNSQTYQLSSIRRSDHPEAEANFAFYPLHRLEAEVLIDALNQITGTTEKYTSAIPEPFTFIPADLRSIALPDGSITSTFLEKFGRPARDTGQENERNNRLTATQRLHLLNSTQIQCKLEQGPNLQPLLRSRGSPNEMINGLYLTVLSRPPTEAERAIAATALNTGPENSRAAALDLAWALINSTEFLYRH